MTPSPLNNSLPHLAQAARLEPDNPEYQALLAESLLREGSSADALMPLKHSLTSRPAPRVFLLAAYALFLEDRLPEALRFAHEAVSKSPVFHRAFYLRGRIQWALGDTDQAIKDFQKAALYGDSAEYVRAAHLNPATNNAQWPSLNDSNLGLLHRERPQGIFDHDPMERYFNQRSDANPHWWTEWSPLPKKVGARHSKKAGYAQELNAARQLLKSGKSLAAYQRLMSLWKDLHLQLTDADDATTKVLIQGTAEALAVTSCQLESREPDSVDDSDLYAAGARFPAFLRRFVNRLFVRDKRSDLFALKVYVTALEQECLNDPLVRRGVLTRLAEALRIHLSSSIPAMEPRVPLLERLHRLREGLVFPRLYLGYARFRTGDFTAARLFWQDLAGPISNLPHVLFLRAQCAENLNLMGEAISLYEASLEQKRIQPHAHFGLGRLLLYGGGK